MLDFVSHIYKQRWHIIHLYTGKVQSIICNLMNFSEAYLHQQRKPTN